MSYRVLLEQSRCHWCRSYWFGRQHALLMRPLSSCYIEISLMSQCRTVWLFRIESHSLLFSFLLTQLPLARLTQCCPCLDQMMTQTDTPSWLTADLWVRKHKCSSFENDSDSWRTIHSLYTAYKEHTITMEEQQQQPISWRHHALACRRNASNEISKKLPDENTIQAPRLALVIFIWIFLVSEFPNCFSKIQRQVNYGQIHSIYFLETCLTKRNFG